MIEELDPLSYKDSGEGLHHSLHPLPQEHSLIYLLKNLTRYFSDPSLHLLFGLFVYTFSHPHITLAMLFHGVFHSNATRALSSGRYAHVCPVVKFSKGRTN